MKTTGLIGSRPSALAYALAAASFMVSFVSHGSIPTVPTLSAARPRLSLLPKAGAGCGWDTRHPPQNGARQIARYSRQARDGQLNAAGGLVE